MLNEKYFSALNSFDSDSYFKLLVIVAGADGNICESELAFLQDQAKLMDYDLHAVLNKGLNLSDIKVQGISIVTKKIVIRDCISLAHIDGVYDKNESEKIHEKCVRIYFRRRCSRSIKYVLHVVTTIFSR